MSSSSPRLNLFSSTMQDASDMSSIAIEVKEAPIAEQIKQCINILKNEIAENAKRDSSNKHASACWYLAASLAGGLSITSFGYTNDVAGGFGLGVSLFLTFIGYVIGTSDNPRGELHNLEVFATARELGFDFNPKTTCQAALNEFCKLLPPPVVANPDREIHINAERQIVKLGLRLFEATLRKPLCSLIEDYYPFGPFEEKTARPIGPGP